eukprot:7205848-Pyramimonas_sp.AAC.1
MCIRDSNGRALDVGAAGVCTRYLECRATGVKVATRGRSGTSRRDIEASRRKGGGAEEVEGQEVASGDGFPVQGTAMADLFYCFRCHPRAPRRIHSPPAPRKTRGAWAGAAR